MTTDVIDWGRWTDERPELLRAIQPGAASQRVFVFRDGALEFPDRPVSVLPFHGITAWGYINTAPVHVRYELTSGLTSRDGVPLYCVVDLELQVQSDPYWQSKLVEGFRSVDGKVRLEATHAVKAAIAQADYAKLFFVDADAHTEVAQAIAEGLRRNTPYRVASCTFQVAAMEPGHDERLASTHGAVARDAATEQYRELEDRERDRRQEQERALLEHDLQMEERRAEAKRARERQRRLDELQAAEAAEERELRAVKRLKEVIGTDKELWLLYKHPRIYAQLQALMAQDRIEWARVIQALQVELAAKIGESEAHQRMKLLLNKTRLDLSDLDDLIDGDAKPAERTTSQEPSEPTEA